jgi:Leucine-rich repeat (LRR) protein
VSMVSLDDRNFSDLSVFTGMKLTSLSLGGCGNVKDLKPLEGMQLRTLNLSFTGVSDLSPLAGMPLVELNLEGCSRISDFTPLKDCVSLEKLLLPRQARDIGFLRKMPGLKFLSYKGLSQPVKEFWAEFDKRKGGPEPVPPGKRQPPAPPAR